MPKNAIHDSNDSKLFFLRHIVFAPTSSQIKLTFQRGREQQATVEKFYPHAYFHATTEQLNAIRKNLDKLNIRALFERNTHETAWKVSSKDEETLSLIQREIHHVTNHEVQLLSVEEQFLVEKNYRIGQAFSNQSGEWLPTSDSHLPSFWIPALDQSVEQTVQEFLNDGQELPIWFKQFAYGFALQMIPENVELNPKILVNTLLVHEAFKKEQPFIAQSFIETKMLAWEKLPRNQLQSFSSVALQNYNLSPDTVDCTCCTPQAYPSTNLLPHSQVQLRANNDGTFVESFHPEFALSFDAKHSNSSTRWNFKSDWKLQHVPIGPLSRSQTMTALLLDAQTWEQQGQTKTISLHHPHWFCVKQTGLLPQSWKSIQQSIQVAREKVGKWYQSGFQEHGLRGMEANWHNPHIAWNQLILEAHTQVLHHFWSGVRENGLISNESEHALKAAYWQWGSQTKIRKLKKAVRNSAPNY